ncbi:hypothetical protein FHU28_006147 [Micromonospora echinospora]|uniref:Uncharacterized protein n=1 Tax=Micromonospora echinospora TaxID=1877 RepID=A0ABR6MLS5_MICEC|nr:hypothetical protein [Micromonospora echinospora]MBB5116308.1 hypothetical protein [Micromonospora echinospora]
MAFRTWGRLLLTALGVSVLAGAGQLGIAYGFGVVRLDGAFVDASVNRWPAQLVWVGWFAVVATVAGAVLTERFARRDDLPGGTTELLSIAGVSALGATVVAPLCMQPARAAELAGSVDPVWAAGVCAALGAVVGAGAAIAVLLKPPFGWGVAITAGIVWLLALLSVAPTIVSNRPLATVRLGVLEPSWLDAAAAQRLSMLLLPTLALLAGGAVGVLTRRAGWPPLVGGAAGAAGPVLVAFAYLTAGPGAATDRYQIAPYYGALIAVVAGALGSTATTMLPRPVTAGDPDAVEATDILAPLPPSSAASAPGAALTPPVTSGAAAPAHWTWPEAGGSAATPGVPGSADLPATVAPGSAELPAAGRSAADQPAVTNRPDTDRRALGEPAPDHRPATDRTHGQPMPGLLPPGRRTSAIDVLAAGRPDPYPGTDLASPGAGTVDGPADRATAGQAAGTAGPESAAGLSGPVTGTTATGPTSTGPTSTGPAATGPAAGTPSVLAAGAASSGPEKADPSAAAVGGPDATGTPEPDRTATAGTADAAATAETASEPAPEPAATTPRVTRPRRTRARAAEAAPADGATASRTAGAASPAAGDTGEQSHVPGPRTDSGPAGPATSTGPVTSDGARTPAAADTPDGPMASDGHAPATAGTPGPVIPGNAPGSKRPGEPAGAPGTAEAADTGTGRTTRARRTRAPKAGQRATGTDSPESGPADARPTATGKQTGPAPDAAGNADFGAANATARTVHPGSPSPAGDGANRDGADAGTPAGPGSSSTRPGSPTGGVTPPAERTARGFFFDDPAPATSPRPRFPMFEDAGGQAGDARPAWPITPATRPHRATAGPDAPVRDGDETTTPAEPTPRPRYRGLPEPGASSGWDALATNARPAGPVQRPEPETAVPAGAALPEAAPGTGEPDPGTRRGRHAGPDDADALAGKPKARRGLFRRNRAKEEPEPADRTAEPGDAADDEYVDWVAGLASDDNTDDARSLRTGRHHRD